MDWLCKIREAILNLMFEDDFPTYYYIVCTMIQFASIMYKYNTESIMYNTLNIEFKKYSPTSDFIRINLYNFAPENNRTIN
jgi:hypothetical protein